MPDVVLKWNFSDSDAILKYLKISIQQILLEHFMPSSLSSDD
jgi:hypothetical protein